MKNIERNSDILNLRRSLVLPPLPWTDKDIVPLNKGQKPIPEGVTILDTPTRGTDNPGRKSA